MNSKAACSFGRAVKFAVIMVTTLLLGACVSVEQVVPLEGVDSSITISPVSTTPEVLPKGMVRFEDSPFVFVHADHAGAFAASLLVPLPFVTDAIVDSVNRNGDVRRQNHYLSIDADALLSEQIPKHERFKLTGGDYALHMLVPIEECIDGVYRLSLLFQLEKDGWMGRYYYHLPTTIPSADISSLTEQELATFRQELAEGMDILITVIENEIDGQYNGQTESVTVGSLYILGGSIGGLVNPAVFKIANATQVSAAGDNVIVRIPGDPSGEANNGGMAFGLHYFRRDQLHTYELAE